MKAELKENCLEYFMSLNESMGLIDRANPELPVLLDCVKKMIRKLNEN